MARRSWMPRADCRARIREASGATRRMQTSSRAAQQAACRPPMRGVSSRMSRVHACWMQAIGLVPGNTRINRALLGLGPTDPETADDVLAWMSAQDTLGDPGPQAPAVIAYPDAGRQVAVIATQDGLIQAFDADSGIELWGWMPTGTAPADSNTHARRADDGAKPRYRRAPRAASLRSQRRRPHRRRIRRASVAAVRAGPRRKSLLRARCRAARRSAAALVMATPGRRRAQPCRTGRHEARDRGQRPKRGRMGRAACRRLRPAL